MCSVYLSSLCSADIQDWGQLHRSGPSGASQTVQPQTLHTPTSSRCEDLLAGTTFHKYLMYPLFAFHSNATNCNACQEVNDLSHGWSSWTWSAACRKSSGVLAQNCTTNGLASIRTWCHFHGFQSISMHFISCHLKMQGYASVFRCFHSDIVQVVIKQVWSGQNLDCNVPLTAHFFGRCRRRKVTYLIKLVKSLHLAVKLESPPTLGN